MKIFLLDEIDLIVATVMPPGKRKSSSIEFKNPFELNKKQNFDET